MRAGLSLFSCCLSYAFGTTISTFSHHDLCRVGLLPSSNLPLTFRLFVISYALHLRPFYHLPLVQPIRSAPGESRELFMT
eukprot:97840-Pyramimonas_sp.AAC.1